MTAPVLFNYQDQQVRTVVLDGEPWFVAMDVCTALAHSNTAVAMQMLDDEDKRTIDASKTDIPNVNPVNPVLWVVSEAGVYELAFRSQASGAKAFKRWITHEVLPAIRKTGSFGQPELDLSNQDHVALIVQAGHAALTRAIEAETKVAELAEIAGPFLDADGDLSVADSAKAMTRAGIKTGATRLFNDLEQRGWIFRAKGDGRWRVAQRAIDQRVMSVLPQSHYHPKTGVLVLDPPQPRVTPKGIQRLLVEYGSGNAVVVAS